MGRRPIVTGGAEGVCNMDFGTDLQQVLGGGGNVYQTSKSKLGTILLSKAKGQAVARHY